MHVKYIIYISLITVVNTVQSQTIDSIATKKDSSSFSDTRHFFTSNAYHPGKGSIVYQNIFISYNKLNVGLTDNFSLGGAIIIGADFRWIDATMNFPIIKNYVNTGFSTIVFFSNGEKNIVITGQLTLGPKNRNISVGLSRTVIYNDLLYTMKGRLEIGDRFYLFTENFISNTSRIMEGALSLSGVRFQIDKRFWLDLGIAYLPYPGDNNNKFVLPIIGYTIPLHKL